MVELDKLQDPEDLKHEKIREELLKGLQNYRKTLSYLLADAPVSILCLPSSMEKVLNDNGIVRLYDLFDADLTKIEGLSVSRLRNLTARIDEFFAML